MANNILDEIIEYDSNNAKVLDNKADEIIKLNGEKESIDKCIRHVLASISKGDNITEAIENITGLITVQNYICILTRLKIDNKEVNKAYEYFGKYLEESIIVIELDRIMSHIEALIETEAYERYISSIANSLSYTARKIMNIMVSKLVELDDRYAQFDILSNKLVMDAEYKEIVAGIIEAIPKRY